jgi:hypothetical protein
MPKMVVKQPIFREVKSSKNGHIRPEEQLEERVFAFKIIN